MWTGIGVLAAMVAIIIIAIVFGSDGDDSGFYSHF